MSGVKLQKLLFLVGPSGSGKTAVGEALSHTLCLPFYDTDALIEDQEHKPICEIFAKNGETYFRALEESIIDNLFEQYSSGIVATGGGLPTIGGLMEKLLDRGITIYLKASIDELWSRLSFAPEELAKRPLLHSKGRKGLDGMLKSREWIYKKAKHIVTTDGLNVKQTVEQIIQLRFV
ncbi:MAG: shikimate kinase [Nitrospirae bacterium]|nr:shikimate kinase [Nitrospirota bacterium]